MNGLNFQAKASVISLKASSNPLKDFDQPRSTVLYVAKFPHKGFAHELVKVLLIFLVGVIDIVTSLHPKTNYLRVFMSKYVVIV